MGEPIEGKERKAMATGCYTEGFKKQVVEKVLGPPRRSSSSVAAEVGVSKSAAARWVKEISESSASQNSTVPPRVNSLSPSDKLEILVKTAPLSEEELGGYLRSRGLYAAQVTQFREEALQGLSGHERPGIVRSELSAERKKSKELEKELRRKEKALAEAAALLMLQKKMQELWGDAENGTGRTTE